MASAPESTSSGIAGLPGHTAGMFSGVPCVSLLLAVLMPPVCVWSSDLYFYCYILLFCRTEFLQLYVTIMPHSCVEFGMPTKEYIHTYIHIIYIVYLYIIARVCTDTAHLLSQH